MSSSSLTGGSIRILWDEDDPADVTITGGVASFTVGGSPVTFPYTLTASTTFTTTHSGVYTVSVQHYGYEIAGTPDGTREVTLRFGEEEIFAPTPDSRATGSGLGAMVRDIVSTDVVDDTSDIGVALSTTIAAQLESGGVSLDYLAANPELLIVGAITRDSSGAATAAATVWPDGATGTYAGTPSTSFPGAVDTYTITHDDGTTVTTYTQPAVTRDTGGAVTDRPAIVVS